MISPSLTSTGERHNERIDALRFFAAALVVLHHAEYIIGPWVSATTESAFRVWVARGQSGVSLFLVLSGYLFGNIAFGEPNREIVYSRFILNRVLRIWPLLLFLLVVGSSLLRADLHSDFWVAVFLLGFDQEVVRGIDIFGPLWTIGVEFRFYLIFPVLVRVLGAEKRRWLGVLLMMSVTRALCWWTYRKGWDAFEYTLLGRFDQLVIGVLLALSYNDLKRLGGTLLPLLGLPVSLLALTKLFFAIHSVNGEGGSPYFMVLSTPLEAFGWALFLYSVLALPQGLGFVWKVLAKMGQWSYSMYLLHVTLVYGLRRYGKLPLVRGDEELNVILNGLVIVLPATIALAALSYTVIEAPFLRLRVKYLRPRFAVALAAPAEPQVPVARAESAELQPVTGSNDSQPA